jgi:hypothetical protein
MGRLLVLSAAGMVGMGAIVNHLNHHTLADIFFCAALLSMIFGLLLWIRHPLAELLEELRRQAD